MNFLSLIKQEKSKKKNDDQKIEEFNTEQNESTCIQPPKCDISGLRYRLTGSVEDFQKFKVGKVDSVYYLPNIITDEDSNSILNMISLTDDWTQLKYRKLKCYQHGFPYWLSSICNNLGNHGFINYDPNHVLINRYELSKNEGILHHLDGPAYLNQVAILSFESSCYFTFRKKLSSDEIGTEQMEDTVKLILEPNSLLLFSDDAYSNYLHGIDPDFDFDRLNIEVLDNKHLLSYQTTEQFFIGQRTSITIRKMF